jgi:hypothetical protein
LIGNQPEAEMAVTAERTDTALYDENLHALPSLTTVAAGIAEAVSDGYRLSDVVRAQIDVVERVLAVAGWATIAAKLSEYGVTTRRGTAVSGDQLRQLVRRARQAASRKDPAPGSAFERRKREARERWRRRQQGEAAALAASSSSAARAATAEPEDLGAPEPQGSAACDGEAGKIGEDDGRPMPVTVIEQPHAETWRGFLTEHYDAPTVDQAPWVQPVAVGDGVNPDPVFGLTADEFEAMGGEIDHIPFARDADGRIIVQEQPKRGNKLREMHIRQGRAEDAREREECEGWHDPFEQWSRPDGAPLVSGIAKKPYGKTMTLPSGRVTRLDVRLYDENAQRRVVPELGRTAESVAGHGR